MSVSDEVYGGLERRQECNTNLRALWTNHYKKVSHISELKEDDLSQLFELMRDHYLNGLEHRSSDLLQLVREQHADEFNPALLTLLDKVKGGGLRG